MLRSVTTCHVYCIFSNEISTPLLLTSSPSLETFFSIPVLHLLFLNLLWLRLEITASCRCMLSSTKRVACLLYSYGYETTPGCNSPATCPCSASHLQHPCPASCLRLLVWDLMHLLHRVRMWQMCNQQCLSPAGGPWPPFSSSIIPLCDACPQLCPLNKQKLKVRMVLKVVEEQPMERGMGGSSKAKCMKMHSWHQSYKRPDGLPSAWQKFHQEKAIKPVYKNREFKEVLPCVGRDYHCSHLCQASNSDGVLLGEKIASGSTLITWEASLPPAQSQVCRNTISICTLLPMPVWIHCINCPIPCS